MAVCAAGKLEYVSVQYPGDVKVESASTPDDHPEFGSANPLLASLLVPTAVGTQYTAYLADHAGFSQPLKLYSVDVRLTD